VTPDVVASTSTVPAQTACGVGDGIGPEPAVTTATKPV